VWRPPDPPAGIRRRVPHTGILPLEPPAGILPLEPPAGIFPLEPSTGILPLEPPAGICLRVAGFVEIGPPVLLDRGRQVPRPEHGNGTCQNPAVGTWQNRESNPRPLGASSGDSTTDLKRSAVMSGTGIHRLIYRDIGVAATVHNRTIGVAK